MRTNRRLLLSMLLGVAISMGVNGNENISDEPKSPAFTVKEESTLLWEGTKPGGKHFGEILISSGTLDTEGKAITGGSFVIDMNSIVCHDLENEKFNERLVNHLKSDDFFLSAEFPKAFFTITGVTASKKTIDGFKATHSVDGELTVRGITRPISFPAHITIQDSKVHAQSPKIALDRTLWNVNHKSKKVFADLKDNYIDDEMKIALDLHFDLK